MTVNDGDLKRITCEMCTDKADIKTNSDEIAREKVGAMGWKTLEIGENIHDVCPTCHGGQRIILMGTHLIAIELLDLDGNFDIKVDAETVGTYDKGKDQLTFTGGPIQLSSES